MRKNFIASACLLGSLLLAAPAQAQNWGTPERSRVSQLAWDGLDNEGPIYAVLPHEPIAQIFQRIVAQAQRDDVQYRLYVQRNDDEVNAYALPDGRLVLVTGLLHALPPGDQDAIAFVIAHEIAHIDNAHAERLGTQSGLTNLALGWLTGGNDWTRLLGGVSSRLLTSGYSRGMEAEADRDGLRMMAAAGYDPVGAIRTLQLFKRLEERDGRSRIFPTHPTAAARLQDTEQFLRENGRL